MDKITNDQCFNKVKDQIQIFFSKQHHINDTRKNGLIEIYEQLISDNALSLLEETNRLIKEHNIAEHIRITAENKMLFASEFKQCVIISAVGLFISYTMNFIRKPRNTILYKVIYGISIALPIIGVLEWQCRHYVMVRCDSNIKI